MSFILYDITFLILFTLFVAIFLYTRKHNLKREGLLYLYRTRWGIRFIEWTTKKYPRLLKAIEYPIVICGYALMFFGIWFIITIAYTYVTSPFIAKALKVPVIMPLIPYLPEIFKIDFLPPFYFTYWIIIIAIIAIPHEFAHGIFARLNKIGILSTGFGFLGPFLAAFVEQNDKQMQKAKKFSQLSILAAGTFANVLMTILFGVILFVFFMAAFSPAGINFNVYALSAVNVSAITSVSTNYTANASLARISSGNQNYFIEMQSLNDSINNGDSYVIAFDDSPAFNAKLPGTIISIDGKSMMSYQDLNTTLLSHKPGDKITVNALDKDGTQKDYDITLSEKDGKAFLGIGLIPRESGGVASYLYSVFAKFKDPFVYYKSSLGDLGTFILDLLWWIVMISLSVALMNMLPLGIFDGGRFFFLTVLGITGSQKIAERAFKFSTWLFLAIIALMLVKWLFIFV